MELEINDFYRCKFPEEVITDLPEYPRGNDRRDMWDDFDGNEDFDSSK